MKSIDWSLDLPILAIAAADALIEEVSGAPATTPSFDSARGRAVGAMLWLLKALAAKGSELYHNPKHFWSESTLEFMAWPDDTDNPELEKLLNGNQYYASLNTALEAVS